MTKTKHDRTETDTGRPNNSQGESDEQVALQGNLIPSGQNPLSDRDNRHFVLDNEWATTQPRFAILVRRRISI